MTSTTQTISKYWKVREIVNYLEGEGHPRNIRTVQRYLKKMGRSRPFTGADAEGVLKLVLEAKTDPCKNKRP
jgi:hypothetical protein